ncbi:MAG: citrate synthase [Pseudomonadota bacterium]
MKNETWIDAGTACARLSVKPQTLYAYVARGRLRSKADPQDARRSLYALVDVEALAAQSRRPRARADVAASAIRWGDPVLETSISDVVDGRLRFRRRAMEVCAAQMTHEEVTAWQCDLPHVQAPDTAPRGTGPDVFARAMAHLAAEAAGADAADLNAPRHLAATVARLISGTANACLGGRYTGPIHARFAEAWALDAGGAEAVRRALVALSDHELNPSTFAVRVCAGTGASLPAALLAGMAILSGPRHGGVAVQTRTVLERVLADGPHAIGNVPSYEMGFGHPLYPAGDPRAALLLNCLPANAVARRGVETVATALGVPPNVDAGLVALSLHLNLPGDAPAALFAIGRMAGWAAHAIEQARSGAMIRPRARYVGPSSAFE